MSELKRALAATNIAIRKYDEKKSRPVYLKNNKSVSVEKFTETLVSGLGKKLGEFPEIVASINDADKMEDLLREYAEEENLTPQDETEAQALIPEELSHLTLNIDRSSKEAGGKRFFCTTKEELVDSKTSGQFYSDSCGLSIPEAVRVARSVVPVYLPRMPQGVHKKIDPVTKTSADLFNTYVPAAWDLWRRRNPNAWEAIPTKAPSLVLKLLKHLIPNRNEREYLYAWIYSSMTSRAVVYLVLCGAPGAGKNRLKLLIRALHGAHNSVDGKKETFGAGENKFNGQMVDNTLMWFDELKYGPEMEPRMKEYQNPYIPIEKKGVDASRSQEIFSSMVISNNYPRDNYILFNSRKFAPLVLADKDLSYSMTPEEITELSEKCDDTHPNFDVKYVARLAKWILSIGPKYANNYKMLEYQGPKFWELAHASMSRWQKIAILALTTQNNRGPFPGWDPVKGAFLWSKVEEALRRKKEYESKDYRDASTVKTFFETYCDETGEKVFRVEAVEKSVVQDFWIVPLKGLKEVRGPLTLNEPSKKSPILLQKDKQVRPAGMSQFQWRKLKESQEKGNSRDT